MIISRTSGYSKHKRGKTSSPMTRFSKFSPNSIIPCTLVPQRWSEKYQYPYPDSHRLATGLFPNRKYLCKKHLSHRQKTLWVATERGIYTYNKETREIQHLTYNPNDDYSLSDNAIYSLYKDAEGGIWIGSYFGGIDYYPTQYATFENTIPS